MALPLASIAATFAGYMALEGMLSYMEARAGDPEADTAALLEKIATENQLRARTSLAAEQLGEERIQSQFAEFNRIPQQALSSAALVSSPREVGQQLRRGQEVQASQTELLEMVASKMGVSPQTLSKASHPGRMGDMTGLKRRAGIQ